MAVQTRATVAALVRVPENGKAELVNGELVSMSPTGAIPGRAGGKIYRSLADYGDRTGRGYAYPDAAFSLGPDPGMKFPVGAPVFAVEVRSEGDDRPQVEAEMRDKRADYFAVGAQVVWDVDLLSPDVVRSYPAPNPDTPAATFRHCWREQRLFWEDTCPPSTITQPPANAPTLVPYWSRIGPP